MKLPCYQYTYQLRCAVSLGPRLFRYTVPFEELLRRRDHQDQPCSAAGGARLSNHKQPMNPITNGIMANGYAHSTSGATSMGHRADSRSPCDPHRETLTHGGQVAVWHPWMRGNRAPNQNALHRTKRCPSCVCHVRQRHGQILWHE